MERRELIKKYISFFKSKGHKEISNASLVPENDPTVLFITAGMQPLVPFLSGQKHPQGKKLVGVQKCIRTGDIEEVGDTTHHTLFEMLGNWSLGDYWKKEAIEYSIEFLIKELEIKIDRLAVSVFEGDENAKKDEESSKIWEELKIKKERIAFLPKSENWWGPAGETGPCGPDTEMFYWKLNEKSPPRKFNSEDENWVEIWNDVFMQYEKDEKGNYNEASQKNIDTGMGVERTIAILEGLEDNYLASMWKPIIEKIELISEHSYGEEKKTTKSMRIIADHLKAAVFIINDGISPGNSEREYVLRRLIRRAIRHGRVLGIENFTTKIADTVYELYNDYKFDKKKISLELQKEEDKFLKTLEQGLRIFEKLVKDNKKIDGKKAFLLYQSYGFPIEMTKELARERNIKIDEKGFEEELVKHQKLSKTASAGKFKSGLADNSKETTKLHTAAHLLDESIRKVLGNDANQRGSNITSERLRYDFSFERKLTGEEKNKIEEMVNEQIKKGLKVSCEEMTLKEAKDSGAVGVFEDKYGEKVRVYTMGDFSKEICSGPHVENTKELGNFKITKETSSSSGVRRIKAILE